LAEVIRLLNKFNLGGADYYHIPGIITTHTEKVIPKEKLLEEMCSTSPAGRGSA
jgi:hypothetical protein